VDDPAVPVTGRLVEGNAAAALVEASREADLLIVGSRGLGGFSGMLLGSVSAQLAHHARCPLLIIRSGVEGDAAD
jgi:nucleotide-binding universal stress UspA family protein